VVRVLPPVARPKEAMSGPDGPEDTGSRAVADAARFEAWRSRNYGPSEERDDTPPRVRYHQGVRVPTRCTCHARSESPCDFCTWPGEDS
jgi:hypothetical protein